MLAQNPRLIDDLEAILLIDVIPTMISSAEKAQINTSRLEIRLTRVTEEEISPEYDLIGKTPALHIPVACLVEIAQLLSTECPSIGDVCVVSVDITKGRYTIGIKGKTVVLKSYMSSAPTSNFRHATQTTAVKKLTTRLLEFLSQHNAEVVTFSTEVKFVGESIWDEALNRYVSGPAKARYIFTPIPKDRSDALFSIRTDREPFWKFSDPDLHNVVIQFLIENNFPCNRDRLSDIAILSCHKTNGISFRVTRHTNDTWDLDGNPVTVSK